MNGGEAKPCFWCGSKEKKTAISHDLVYCLRRLKDDKETLMAALKTLADEARERWKKALPVRQGPLLRAEQALLPFERPESTES